MKIVQLKQQNGFTLVELLVGIAVLSILMAAVFGILSSSSMAFQYDYGQTQNVAEARKAINQIADELRYITKVDNTGFTAVSALEYKKDIGGTAILKFQDGSGVTRTISRPTSSGSDYQTIIIQNESGANAATTYRFGRKIATSLTVTRTNLDATATSPIRLRVTLTMNDTNYKGGQPLTVTTDIISPNMLPAGIVTL